MSTNNPKDIIIWAHSDQMGGAEIAHLLALSLQRAAQSAATSKSITPSADLKIAIALPPDCKPGADWIGELYKRADSTPPELIETKPLLKLEKTQLGAVDHDRTLALVRERFIGTDGGLTPLNSLIGHFEHTLRDEKRVVKEGHTLFISCGEPVALRVAQACRCKGIIVTDHLLTFTMRSVLEHGGLLDSPVARLMTEFENFDRSAAEAYLAPVEFGQPEYVTYLAMGGLPCIPIRGLLYRTVNRADLVGIPQYDDLVRLSSTHPLVIVFGGGGRVWDGIFSELHRIASTEDFPNAGFHMLVRDIDANGKVVRGRFKLYRCDQSEAVSLTDPGLMMHWYPASRLVVGRGGLVAQQILSIMLSDLANVPDLLFVEEPGHPQIESERQSLYRQGLVHSRTLESFKGKPLEVIKNALDNPLVARHRVRVRYSRSAMETLARAILAKYFGYDWHYGTS